MPPKLIITYIVVMVVLFFIIQFLVIPKAKKILTGARYQLVGGTTADGSSMSTISENRKNTIASYATDLYEAVNSSFGGFADRATPLSKINALNDAEFIYAFESYMRQFNKNPYYEVDWETISGDSDDKFLSRSKALNLPIRESDVTPKNKKG